MGHRLIEFFFRKIRNPTESGKMIKTAVFILQLVLVSNFTNIILGILTYEIINFETSKFDLSLVHLPVNAAAKKTPIFRRSPF